VHNNRAALPEVVRLRRLGDVEEREQFADADLAGVLAEHVDEVQAALATSAMRSA